MAEPVLVCGATGQIGSLLRGALDGAGVPWIGLSRRPPQGGAGAQWRVGDFERPASLGPALDGVGTVFLASSDHPRQDVLEIAMIDACRSRRIKRVVKLSAQSAGHDPPVSFGVLHARAEQVIEGRSGAVPLTGGCFCGKVRYKVDAPLGPGRSCHCSRCRKAFSGAGSAYAEVVPGSFSWVAGEENLTFYETTPGWGLCFCRTCGSTLCGTAGDQVHGVTLGSVDGDPGVQIEKHLFVDSRAPWDHIGGNAAQYPEFPPRDPSK